jgi:hypothetical protein
MVFYLRAAGLFHTTGLRRYAGQSRHTRRFF